MSGTKEITERQKELFVLAVFQREIAAQCRHALLAVALINAGLQARAAATGPPRQDAHRQVWFGLQSLLIAAANVSKLLWGSRSTDAVVQAERDAFRAKLRKSLGVKANSPPRSRKFRNFFEHIDVEIEWWVKTSKRHILVEDLIGPKSAIRGVNWRDFMRTFDPETLTVTFRRAPLQIQPIVDALNALLTVAEEASTVGYAREMGKLAQSARDLGKG